MTLRTKQIVPIILAVFIAGIGGTMFLNLWQTTSSKIPATYTSGEFAGQANPGDIRGSYSFGDIEASFGVPVSALAAAFEVTGSEDPSGFLCKELEDRYAGLTEGEIGTDSVRWFVALYAGLPYTPADDTLLPAASLAVLQGRLSDAELQEVRSKTTGSGTDQSATPTEEAAPVAAESGEQAAAIETPVTAEAPAVPQTDTHSETTEGEVRGKTTFGELLSWGVSKETIEQALGLPIGKPGVAVRDYCTENGIEFSSVRDALQKAADQALSGQ
jgi:hypothetical protein